MNTRTLLALGLVIVGACVWFAWSSDAEPSLGSRAAPGERASAGLAASPQGTPSGDAFAPREAGEPTADSSRVAVAPGRRVAVPQAVRLLVLLPDERPAAGATIRYLPPGLLIPEDKESDDIEEELRAAAATTSDEHGRVDLVAQANSDLCARLGDHYAAFDLSTLDEDSTAIVTLVLQRDVSLRVRVTDRDGRPREGIVVLAALLAASRTAGEIDEVSRTSRTDAAGLATLAHLQTRLPMPAPEHVRWQLRLHCHGFDDPTASRFVTPVELANREPFDLVVASGGSVVARVLDADGRPWFGGAALVDVASGARRAVHHNSLRDGTQWFRQVPLGGSWCVNCEGRDEPGFTSAAFAGPTSFDQVVEIAMTVPERSWEVKGRIVRPDGLAMERTELTCRTRHFVERRPQAFVGRFTFHCRLPATIEVIDDLTLDVHVGEEPTAVRIDRAIRSGRTDLGDVVVPMPVDDTLLATVEVRCEDHVISGASHVELHALVDDRPHHEIFTVRSMNGTAIELRGQAPGTPMILRCQHADCRGKAVPVARGERIVVELERRTDLRVLVRPPLVPRDLIHGELVRDGDADTSQLGTNGQITWWNVDPGSYLFRITVDGVSCFESPIELRPGHNVWPADGSALDLRDRIRAFHLDIVPADGVGEIEDLVVFCMPFGVQSLPDDYHDLALAHARWFVPRPRPVELLIHASGFVPVRLRAPTADTIVPMQRLTTLAIHGPTEPDTSVTLRIVAHGVTDAPLRALMAEEIAEEQHVTPPFPQEVRSAPGTVHELIVHRNGNPGAPQRVVVGAASPQVVHSR